MIEMGGKRLWSKQDLAEFLGCKVSYVSHKVQTRQWPHYLFHEIRFGPQHVAEILASSERPAMAATEPRPAEPPGVTTRPLTPRRALPMEPPADFVPLRARPERARSYKSCQRDGST